MTAELKVKYTKDCTIIYNSCLIKNNILHRNIFEIIEGRKLKGYPVTRTINSYYRETKAHNRLYRLGLWKSHTKDTDLEEDIKWWKEIVYFILSI